VTDDSPAPRVRRHAVAALYAGLEAACLRSGELTVLVASKMYTQVWPALSGTLIRALLRVSSGAPVGV
jgi:hypothetical protein